MANQNIIIHNKLVRDLIPEFLERRGIHCITKTIDGPDLIQALKKKLLEEIYEYLAAQDSTKQLEELADVIEVIRALLENQDLTFSQLETIRLAKLDEKGGFERQLFLERTECVENSNPSLNCLFCRIAKQEVDVEIFAKFKHCFVIKDKFPVSPGHLLIIPFDHTENWFTAKQEVRLDMMQALENIKMQLDHMNHPDGYNIGANCGEAAGQTVMHLHLHLIPRYKGDMSDPRGGVRGVIPTKQKY